MASHSFRVPRPRTAHAAPALFSSRTRRLTSLAILVDPLATQLQIVPGGRVIE